jgi:hypothetical protein
VTKKLVDLLIWTKGPHVSQIKNLNIKKIKRQDISLHHVPALWQDAACLSNSRFRHPGDLPPPRPSQSKNTRPRARMHTMEVLDRRHGRHKVWMRASGWWGCKQGAGGREKDGGWRWWSQLGEGRWATIMVN